MKKVALLLLLAGCSTAPIKKLTYDPEIVWDHDQLRICAFTSKDQRLDCMTKKHAYEAVMRMIDDPVQVQRNAREP